MNQMEIFKNPEFGSIRVIEENGKYLFCGTDVAAALGYSNSRDAIIRHCRYVVKRDAPHPQSPDRKISMTFIPEGDLYRLIVHSKLPSAEQFEQWVFDEVLPILLPIGYIQHHPPIHVKKSINKYTAKGRAEIHKNLESVDMTILHILMRNPIEGASIEYNDNRLSLYAAQHGVCAITKQILSVEEIHCHHKTPKSQGGGDEYANLIILHKDIHRLVHATQRDTISAIMQKVQLKSAELKKLNKLRVQAGNEVIQFE